MSGHVFPTGGQAPATTRNPGEHWKNTLIGASHAMQVVHDTIELVAPRKCTVLISGATGTGKEVAARAIHMASDRARMPMLAVNCAALPEHLLEAELFGHTKGAFTGAISHRAGHFERAHNGTLFLDEIGDMPLEVQAKLLRVLQEGELLRLGSSTPIKVDVRIIAATNIDLAEAVRARRFRPDLYYRLNVVPIRLPALRERASDIPLLVQHFLSKICSLERIPMKTISHTAMQRLSGWNWPGNVRELEHAIEKAVMLAGDREVLAASDFDLEDDMLQHGPDMELPDTGVNFEEVILQIERALLAQALRKADGNRARAAVLLGMKRTTLLSKIKAIGASVG
ncbi:MAG: sigma 54-interacting transcriptional regulator [Bryobacterales bacterium]|nr:sigma 54-interacting transcriptional regulator [Bryobacterales bacterium]